MTGDTVADRRVHPLTVPLRFLKEAPSTLLGLPAAFAYISDYGWAEVAMVASAIAVAAILYQWIAWRSFRYGLGASDIVIERGILHRTRRSIPFHRVQDVDIERGPLQRLFGLAKLRIETGGAAKDEGLLDSVGLDEADRLRGAIRAGRAGVEAPTEPSETAPEARTIFAMAMPRVLLAGLYGFSLVWIAGLFALLQAFEDWLPFDLYDPGRWLGLANDSLADRLTAGGIAAVLMVALVLGIVAGVARTIGRDHGFRLTSDGARFRRERGLITRSETVVPKRRVQLARLQTGPIRRHFGWFGLFFQTLSPGKDGGGHQVVAPLARSDEVDAILAEQEGLRVPAAADLAMVSSRHLVRVMLREVGLPAIAILIGAFLFPPVLTAALVLPLLVARAFLERRFHRYGLVGDTLYVQRGVWRQRLWIVPVAKIQALRLGRSFLQRRLGLASLLIDTAGASDFNAPRIVDLGEATARALVARLRAPA